MKNKCEKAKHKNKHKLISEKLKNRPLTNPSAQGGKREVSLPDAKTFFPFSSCIILFFQVAVIHILLHVVVAVYFAILSYGLLSVKPIDGSINQSIIYSGGLCAKPFILEFGPSMLGMGLRFRALMVLIRGTPWMTRGSFINVGSSFAGAVDGKVSKMMITTTMIIVVKRVRALRV